jgi:terpene synthase-like protein
MFKTVRDKKLVPNPNVDVVQIESSKLAASFNFQYRSELARLSAYVYPTHTKDQLLAANNWIMWLYLFDDYVDDHASVSEALKLVHATYNFVRTLTSNLTCSLCTFEDRHLQLLSCVLQQIQHAFATSIYNYFLIQVEKYLLKGVKQNLLKRGAPLSVQEYNEVRFYDGGCNTVWPLILTNSTVRSDFFTSTIITKAMTLSTVICNLINDVYSVHKDLPTYNYVHLLASERKVPVAKVLVEVIKKLDADYEHLRSLYNIAKIYVELAHLVPELQQIDKFAQECNFIGQLVVWVEGCFIFHDTCKRYEPTFSTLPQKSVNL